MGGRWLVAASKPAGIGRAVIDSYQGPRSVGLTTSAEYERQMPNDLGATNVSIGWTIAASVGNVNHPFRTGSQYRLALPLLVPIEQSVTHPQPNHLSSGHSHVAVLPDVAAGEPSSVSSSSSLAPEVPLLDGALRLRLRLSR